jgi:tetratricopeptide (TPR) repeat protein
LAEQAKILYAEAEENNLGDVASASRWARWYECSLCEQRYHGVVKCALGWACWKTYVGRPETDEVRGNTMTQLGLGLQDAGHFVDALSVQEAQLSMLRRFGADEVAILAAQSNLALTYSKLGRLEQALCVRRDVYSTCSKLFGEHGHTLLAANNYGYALYSLQHFEGSKSLLRKTIPVARRVLGENSDLTLRIRWNYAQSLSKDPNATLDDLREAVTTLEDVGRTARRVLGGAHPLTVDIEEDLEGSRAALRAREGDDVSSVCEAVAAANLH